MQTKTMTELDKEIAAAQAELANVHGSECEVYARIVGYYRSVKNWNKGKKEEYGMRSMFDQPSETRLNEHCGSCAVQQVTLSVAKAANSSVASTPGYEMFVRSTCPNCPPVKDYMARTAMQGVQVDVDTEAGLHEAASRGVFSAPTVIFFDANGLERARAHTTEELDEILHAA